jgi:hypothetical protein
MKPKKIKPKKITKNPHACREAEKITHNIVACFPCSYEWRNKKRFQEQGHFVPGAVDEEGRRREWKGAEVHVLQLDHEGRQILRVLSDSQRDAEHQMQRAIREHFSSLVAAAHQGKFSYDAFLRADFERNQMAALLRAKGFDKELQAIAESVPKLVG